MKRALTIAIVLLGLVPGASGVAGDAPSNADADRFFERSVRPVLAENCFSCHGATKQKGGLRLDSRAEILKGGDSGPAIEPGKPEESLLISAVHREDGLEMPPKGKLPDPAVAALEQWVRMGAPWPGGTTAASDAKLASRGAGFTDEDRAWWSFQPVRDTVPPKTDDRGWSRGPIDRFIWAKLQSEGLTPAPEADKRALIRRLTFDVIGLPPSPAEIEAFAADEAPDAYERLVDRLLASPRYGERWARHWLDLVRYAESDGYRIDHYRPQAWLYRDYVIRSFNTDKPYDRFVQEQLAGDELFPDSPDALIATGYLRHTIYEYNNRDARGQWGVILNDITDTTADVFMGLGLQCARCHNHKFDPILQADYFRLQAFFASILPHDDLVAATPDQVEADRPKLAAWEEKTADLRRQIAAVEAPFREIASREAIGRFPDDIQAMIHKPVDQRSALEHQVARLAYRQVDYEYDQIDTRVKGKDKEKLLALRKQLTAFDREKPKPLPTPHSVKDVGPDAPPITIPKKGDDPIPPGFPTIIEERPATIEHVDTSLHSTGRRATLAHWLTRPDNPLSTRVIVNRVWQYHFGRGLAANPSDFGRLGETPSHPELLDWLTTQFIREGWTLKSLHRKILTSAAYRQSTEHPTAAQQRLKDPENRLYWRGNTRRLDAEQIRDAVLAVTGELDLSAGGPGVLSTEPRRTIYTRVMRNTRDPFLDVFDLPLFFNSQPSRDTTTSPLQSLLLINSQMMLLRAQAFAGRIEKEPGPLGTHPDPIESAYRLAFGRPPTLEEVASAQDFLREQANRIDPAEAGTDDAAFLRDKVPNRDGHAAVLSPDGPQQRLEVPHRIELNTSDFTIEAFFLLHSVYDTGTVRTVVSKWDGNLKTPGWSFGVTGKGSRRKPQTLVLQMVGQRDGAGFGEEAIFSDQTVRLDRPYFAAASVTLSTKPGEPGSVTFFLKDLSNDDEPLLIAKVPHRVTGGTDNSLPLTIGALSTKPSALFDGLVDDVRLSDGPLEAAQLLYTVEGASRRSVGYWRFETEPGVLRDSTGHGLDLQPLSRSRGQVDRQRAALIDFCHVLLNSNEFLYVN